MSEELAPVQRPTFWAIADDLHASIETLELIDYRIENFVTGRDEELPQLQQERQELVDRVDRLAAELLTKTDSLVGVIRRLESDVPVLKAEEQRFRAKRKAAERAIEWLKNYTASTMHQHNWKFLKTTLNTITLQNNGGVIPLVIDNPMQLPDHCRDLTIKMRADLWKALCEAVKMNGLPPDAKLIADEPNTKMIREELTAPCDQCSGTGKAISMRKEPEPCIACNGSGTQSLPGAHLGTRGRHIRLS